MPLWGVVGRFAGWFSCGWCIGCWLLVSWRLWASGGVWWRFVVVSFICVDGLGVGFLVSCGGVVWRRGCRPACRVVVRGVCGVWCDFHVEDIAGCCCLVICNLSPPPRLEGVLGCFRRWVAFFAF